MKKFFETHEPSPPLILAHYRRQEDMLKGPID